MRSDDLVPLLAGASEADVGFRQGKIVAWDAQTGANTVELGGQQFTDLPVLSASGISLSVGDVVGLLRYRSTYLILGRINTPENFHGSFPVAGFMGPADTQTALWPVTTSGSLTDLYAGWTQRFSNRLIFYARTEVGASTTGEYQLHIDGVSVLNSGTYSAGIGNFNGMVTWPAASSWDQVHSFALKARRISGAGTIKASVQGLIAV